MSPSLSPKLTLALIVFGAGLAVVGLGAALLLARVERGTRAEDAARRILRNSALPFMIQLLVRAVDLGFFAVMVRVVSVAEFGDYELAALLVTLYLGTISEWGLGVLLTREVARDRQAIRSSFGTALLLRVLLSLAAFPLALLVIGGYQALQATGLFAHAISARGATLIGILALTLLPGALGGAVTSVFLATERPVVPALANLLNNVASTALRLTALLLGYGVIGVAWAALGATILNAAVFIWLMRRDFGWPGWQWDGGLARMLLAAAFPLMLNSLLVNVFFRFDTFVIEGYRGPAAVGVYTAAYKIAPLALIIPPIVVNALFPRFARQALDDRQGLLRGYRLTLRLLLLAALPLVVGASVFALGLMRLLTDKPEFVTPGAPVLAVLVWFVPFSYINGITQYVLIALNRQGTITRAFALTALFNLLGNLLLAPVWGLPGAAAMTVASEIVLYLPFHRMLQRELGEAPFWSLLWRPAAAALAAGAVMVVGRQLPFVALGAGLVTYGAVLWSLRTFTTEDRELWKRLVGMRRTNA